jgi:hypothetical protein
MANIIAVSGIDGCAIAIRFKATPPVELPERDAPPVSPQRGTK